jgi:prepilin-type N-terminal cleavage/methylation domain-containing protein/prepilin-type processing-associated H-X9-DG protein
MRARPAFSLIELLVVIGIIALLVALLAPAIISSRRQAQAVQCRSQLHQIGLAMTEYAMDNDGWVIPYDYGPWAGIGNRPWCDNLFGVPYPPVGICPTAVDGEQLSYQVNTTVKFTVMLYSGPFHRPPQDTILVGENVPGTDTLESMGTYQGDVYLTRWDPARHGRRLGSNYLFLDMHVSNELPPCLPGDPDPWSIGY